jgi:hypothetical protein
MKESSFMGPKGLCFLLKKKLIKVLVGLNINGPESYNCGWPKMDRS